MPNKSKKGPDEVKNFNIPLEGRLHQRIETMARAHRRSLRQEILTCLENCLARWELEDSISRRAAADRGGVISSTAPREGLAKHQVSRG